MTKEGEGGFNQQKENIQKIAGLKVQAELKRFRFDLPGFQDDTLDTPEAKKAIEDLEKLLTEFEEIHDQYQKKVNNLRSLIFKKY